MNIPTINDADARGTAEAFFTRNDWVPRITGLPVTDVETMAMRVRYHVSTMKGLAKVCGSWGLGYYNVPEQRYLILIDEDSYAKKYESAQFTIAEELAHKLIHWEHIKNIKSLKERINFQLSLGPQSSAILESQAKKVASALLLPAQKFEEWVLGHCSDNSDGLKAERYPAETQLASKLSIEIAPKLQLSQDIVFRALLRNSPDATVFKVISELNLQVGK